jgi:hypothetical protein
MRRHAANFSRQPRIRDRQYLGCKSQSFGDALIVGLSVAGGASEASPSAEKMLRPAPVNNVTERHVTTIGPKPYGLARKVGTNCLARSNLKCNTFLV